MLHLETDIEQLCLDELKEYCIQFEKKVTHDCFDHLKIVKKAKTNKNGSDSLIYFRQCQICGCQKLQLIKEINALELNDFHEIDYFNYEIESNYNKDITIYKNLYTELFSREASEDQKIRLWLLNRELILEKEKNELLLAKLIEYKKNSSHKFIYIINKFLKQEYFIKEQNEQLKELFSHPNYPHKEVILKEWFEKKFSKFFEFRVSSWGICDFDNSTIEIDYIIKLSESAKKHILQHVPDFKDIGYFGVEVKYFDITENSHKFPEAFAQCIDYSFSKFHIENESIYLPCIVLLSNLSFDKEYLRYEENYDAQFRIATFIDAQKKLARKFNIGEFRFETEPNSLKLKNWAIKFLDQNYIRYTINGVKTTYSQSKNLSLERKVGNRS